MEKQLSQEEINKLSDDVKYGRLKEEHPTGHSVDAGAVGSVLVLVLAIGDAVAAAAYAYINLLLKTQGGSPLGLESLFWPLAWLAGSILALAGAIWLVNSRSN